MKTKTHNKCVYCLSIAVNLPLIVVYLMLFLLAKVLHEFVWWLNNQTTSFYNFMYGNKLIDLLKIPVDKFYKKEV